MEDTYIHYGRYIHTQTALDFKFNLEAIARNDIFQKKILCYITKEL